MNIRELANSLQLSPGTVSRSLRQHPGIPTSTRERVIQAAALLGYTPRVWTPRRAVAKSPEPSALRSIGVLVGDGYGLRANSVENSFLAHYFLASVQAAAQSADATTSTAFIEKEDLAKLINPASHPPLLRGAPLDGLVLIYPFPDAVVTQLAKRWACVGIERNDTRGIIDCIGHGQIPALSQSVSLLHQLGHRRIGFIADIHAVGARIASNERLAGYLTGMDRHGLEADPSNTIGLNGPHVTDSELVATVAQRVRAGVTGWVCALDRQAYLLMRDLPGLGLEVPRDVSIVGFSGIDPLFGLPQATTWRIPYELIGAAAINALLSRGRDLQSPISYREFPCTFVEGTTTGVPTVH